jgi:hypothetical protein
MDKAAARAFTQGKIDERKVATRGTTGTGFAMPNAATSGASNSPASGAVSNGISFHGVTK